jgi:tRNA A-37 threonylcarbamoyl transferase component Bud32
MNPTREIPDDAALPGLAVMRERGLARTLPALGLRGPVELVMRGYTKAKRMTLEARRGDLRLAVKACANDPTPEAQLYQELAAHGLAPGPARARTAGVRAPPLLAWDAKLRLLATGWLEGPALNDLIREGQGERAGELASRWIRRAASLPVMHGPALGPATILDKAPGWVGMLARADAELGSAAAALLRELGRTAPSVESTGLVHGTLYARHIIDTGTGSGLIDWDGFGRGPAELDAGTFLATVRRIGLSSPGAAAAVAGAELAFLAGTAGQLDESTLAWYRAAALLRIARRLEIRSSPNWKARALRLLSEADRLAMAAAA